MILFENYKKKLIKENPNLTNEQMEKILELIALVAKQTVTNHKNFKPI